MGFKARAALKLTLHAAPFVFFKKKQAQRGSALIKTRIRLEIPVLHESAQLKPKEASQTHSKPNL
jgi:hypothetical protein